jgi:hypothetical protein
MTQQSALLLPFERSQELIGIRIAAAAIRKDNFLSLRYRIEGPINRIVCPISDSIGNRANLLWQNTCFEAFWGVLNSKVYWELNLAPSGDWNLYKFDNYRTNQIEEEQKHDMQFQSSKTESSLSIGITLELPKEISIKVPIELNLTSVLQQVNGQISHWALVHCLSEPDFHQRDSFLLQL